MAVLVVGLILFLGVHAGRIAAPGLRGRMVARIGEGPYRGIYALVSIIGFALIIVGFGQARTSAPMVYTVIPGLRYVAAVIVLPALILAVASVLPAGRIREAVRHPLLLATILWAVAHLFVNGDLAGVVLFGTFLVWATLDLLMQPRRAVTIGGNGARSDVIAVSVGVALYAALVWGVHAWLFGVSPLA